MHEKFVCFNYMQPQKVKFKSVQINMKQVSYIVADHDGVQLGKMKINPLKPDITHFQF